MKHKHQIVDLLKDLFQYIKDVAIEWSPIEIVCVVMAIILISWLIRNNIISNGSPQNYLQRTFQPSIFSTPKVPKTAEKIVTMKKYRAVIED